MTALRTLCDHSNAGQIECSRDALLSPSPAQALLAAPNSESNQVLSASKASLTVGAQPFRSNRTAVGLTRAPMKPFRAISRTAMHGA